VLFYFGVSLEGNPDKNGSPKQITVYTELKYIIYNDPYLRGFNKDNILWKNGV
jgi:hypothetical protein